MRAHTKDPRSPSPGSVIRSASPAAVNRIGTASPAAVIRIGIRIGTASPVSVEIRIESPASVIRIGTASSASVIRIGTALPVSVIRIRNELREAAARPVAAPRPPVPAERPACPLPEWRRSWPRPARRCPRLPPRALADAGGREPRMDSPLVPSGSIRGGVSLPLRESDMSSAEAKAAAVLEPPGDPVMYHVAPPQRRLHPLRDEDTIAVHLVMELCADGELFNRIVKKGHYTERKATELARVIVGDIKMESWIDNSASQ
ncbi:uncharacterized protein LOC110430372 isoform X2 [Sorghum bicolor]|uniref:uncharacterized protein LOC110430372 isoform X2 n=1 Tax=Sorghum bicolor TaxID=4558 RepID=UPI000B4261D4|nr:uncharacterized protein LOC110430372 isoform X2 [Sorghum bicolor]|eukprot:XP_021303692.1 uncharacterized protein LOC110430372 isoform X2 [Sorghum bicolor]